MGSAIFKLGTDHMSFQQRAQGGLRPQKHHPKFSCCSRRFPLLTKHDSLSCSWTGQHPAGQSKRASARSAGKNIHANSGNEVCRQALADDLENTHSPKCMHVCLCYGCAGQSVSASLQTGSSKSQVLWKIVPRPCPLCVSVCVCA